MGERMLHSAGSSRNVSSSSSSSFPSALARSLPSSGSIKKVSSASHVPSTSPLTSVPSASHAPSTSTLTSVSSVPVASKELPELSKEDTQCGYCGVSYLIHSKVKSLEEKVKTLKEQLQRFEAESNLEEFWQKENQRKIDAVKAEHQKEIEVLWDKHNQTVKDQQIAHRNAMQPLHEDLNRKQRVIRKMGNELKMILARVMSYRMQFNQFKTEVHQKVQQTAGDVAAIGPPIVTRVFALKINALEQTDAAKKSLEEANQMKSKFEGLAQEVADATAANKSLQTQLKKSQDHNTEKAKEIEQLQKKIDELNSTIKGKDLTESKLRKEIKNGENGKVKLTSEMSSLSQNKESEIKTLKSKLDDLSRKLEEESKQSVAKEARKEKEIDAHKSNILTLEKKIVDLTQDHKDTLTKTLEQHQLKLSQTEKKNEMEKKSKAEEFKSELSELRGQLDESQTKNSDLERALAKTILENSSVIEEMQQKTDSVREDLEMHKTEIASLQTELEIEKESKQNYKPPEPETLPLEVMEAQLLKLGDIITKKEREIRKMQMVIQQECDERAELKGEIFDLREKLARYETQKR